MTELLKKAAVFAATAHAGQVRKYTGEPYYEHCRRVAEAVLAAGADEATAAAAYLHDTIEDTATNYQQLITEFGREIADLVVEVTDVYTAEAYPELNRKARKGMEVARLAQISSRAKMIKRADITDNVSTIEMLDPKFAAIYLPEKRAALAACQA